MEAGEKDTKPRIEVIDSENRRYPRFDIQLPIEFDQIKSSITRTGNISEGGLLIYLAEETDVSQYVRLKLFISLGAELNTIEVLAEVVWTDNHLSKDQEYYPCGVKFVDISPEDDAKLKNVLKKLSSPLDEKGKDWTPKKPTETDDMTELQKVVVRYRDGRIIKGFTRNFFPNKDLFHVSPPDDPYGEGKRVQMRELKAVFFVRDFNGNSEYRERRKYKAEDNPFGYRVEVTFSDGEVQAGATMSYSLDRMGFFITPADPGSNNRQIFAISTSVESVRRL